MGSYVKFKRINMKHSNRCINCNFRKKDKKNYNKILSLSYRLSNFYKYVYVLFRYFKKVEVSRATTSSHKYVPVIYHTILCSGIFHHTFTRNIYEHGTNTQMFCCILFFTIIRAGMTVTVVTRLSHHLFVSLDTPTIIFHHFKENSIQNIR